MIDFLERQSWKFAKTMKNIPHSYILEHTSDDPEIFQAVHSAITEEGVPEKFWRKTYYYYYANGYKYWSMLTHDWKPIINRAKVIYENVYDSIDPKEYDHLFNDDDHKQEEIDLFKILGSLNGSVLDFGCGTGLLLNYYDIDDYVGIDTSERMLDEFKLQHPGKIVIRTSIHHFRSNRQFDNVTAIFSGQYINPLTSIVKHWNGTGKMFLMFYKNDYSPPDTYKHFNISNGYEHYSKEDIERVFDQDVYDWKNYYIMFK